MGLFQLLTRKNPGILDGWLGAADGGGVSGGIDVIFLGAVAPFEMYWTLPKQDDGTYAF